MADIQENHLESDPESDAALHTPPLFLRQLSPDMRRMVEKCFWSDFSDIIPSMVWDNLKQNPQ